MRLLHVTHVDCLESILDRGLVCSFARGKWPVIWLARPDMEQWAIRHLTTKRTWKQADLVVLTLEVPARWLRPHWDGIYLHFRDVHPSRIIEVDHVPVSELRD